MPYGDLEAQACQRYGSADDLVRHGATIEEREEYELHLSKNVVVYAGVDYERILRSAEAEADIIIWDGGNNDLPFFRPDLMICVADALRPGHEISYHPGEANLRMADVVIVNKVDSADQASVEIVKHNTRSVNPNATIIDGASPIEVDRPELVKDKRVLVIEDGPTITHGGMGYGAGMVAAKRFGAAEIIDPHKYAVGTLADTLQKWGHIGAVLPAMGYDRRQIEDLEETIRQTSCDTIVSATPVDLTRIVNVNKPVARVYYDLHELTRPNLAEIVAKKFGRKGRQATQVTLR
jgi:predicted GTPase